LQCFVRTLLDGRCHGELFVSDDRHPVQASAELANIRRHISPGRGHSLMELDIGVKVDETAEQFATGILFGIDQFFRGTLAEQDG
jgi:hypothetical protein